MFSYLPSTQNPHSTGTCMNYQYSRKHADSHGQQNCKHLYLEKRQGCQYLKHVYECTDYKGYLQLKIRILTSTGFSIFP